jgi:hypothetical protein
MRPRLRAVLVLVLTLGLLAFFFKDVEPAAIWRATRGADARLLPDRCLLVRCLTARAFRWRAARADRLDAFRHRL